MVDVDSGPLESFVFKLTFGLLEWITSCVFELLVTELSPRITSSIASFCLESIVSSILGYKSNFIFVYSWKKLFCPIFIVTISISLIFLIILLNRFLLYLNFRFNFFKWLNFFFCFLWCDLLFNFFFFEFKFLFGIKIRRVNWAFYFFIFFVFFNLFFLHFRLRSLFRFTLLLRRFVLFN